MPKSSLSDITTKRLKEPFDPALDAPVALTPDQIDEVAGGFVSAMSVLNGGLRSVFSGATTGIIAPPPPPLSSKPFGDVLMS